MSVKQGTLSDKQRRSVARMRLGAQGLLRDVALGTSLAPARSPHEVIASLGMLQAQDLPQACWGVGVRLPGAKLSDVHAAFADGSVIRTWGARGTLMLIVPQHYRILLSVTGGRMDAQMKATRAAESITDREIESLSDVARASCSAGGATRAELLTAFNQAGSSTQGQRGYHLIAAVALRGAIVQGPMEPGSETRQLFMDTDSWVGAQDTSIDPVVALEWLLRDYFRSHGPATLADCAWWLGMPLTALKAALKARIGELDSMEAGGNTYYFAPEHRPRWQHPPGARSLAVLPGFDEFLLGYKDRSATLAPEFADIVTPGKNGLFRRTVAAGGEMIGTWELERKAARQQARFVPFADDPSPSRAQAITAGLATYLSFRNG